jgi:hypothetical protein
MGERSGRSVSKVQGWRQRLSPIRTVQQKTSPHLPQGPAETGMEINRSSTRLNLAVENVEG